MMFTMKNHRVIESLFTILLKLSGRLLSVHALPIVWCAKMECMLGPGLGPLMVGMNVKL